MSLHRLNPEKIFEELKACPKEVCLLNQGAKKVNFTAFPKDKL